jgi:cardiolipin synthase (CMP-forming)
MYAIIDWPIIKFKYARDYIEDNIIGYFMDFIPWWITSNGLSYLRMFLAIPINYLIFFNRDMEWAVNLFIFAWITDYLDGVLARRRGQETAYGAALDPVADKILIISIFCCSLYFVIQNCAQLKDVLIANILVDFLIFIAATVARLRKKDIEIKSNIFGKLKFGFQCVGILMIINANFNDAEKVLRVAFWLSVISFAIYVFIGVRKNPKK